MPVPNRYVIVGASHAGLEALRAIRMQDAEGSLAMITRDDALPYSPTVLPYVVSGRSAPERVALKDEAWFAEQKAQLLRGRTVTAVEATANQLRLDDGSLIGYERLLLATGAAPQLPPIPGLRGVKFHVLRRLDDAIGLHAALPSVKQAVVLGAGLIGMHAAENLAKAGVQVTLVELQPRVLAGYFDADAAAIIESAFSDRGVRLLLGRRAAGVAADGAGIRLQLDDGSELTAGLLLVATGVAPAMECIADSGIATDRGILVDERMQTSVGNVWAAGDVAQARDFYGTDAGARIINGILPDAVEQGRIAGQAMAGDPALRPYPGGVPLNTYTFFGQQAVSVGRQDIGETVLREADRARYLKIVMQQDQLTGIFGINAPFDPGIMWELILRRIDLGPLRAAFLADPQTVARRIMSRSWR
ncbi:MAG: NAD(P)/FAD-dependent oxidoreductase [Gammaproteobacteria bacterium]|nr:MAG: NAD(P)/FAD-dependent oxidoreductase [Gammaproteobacteria bacterium]